MESWGPETRAARRYDRTEHGRPYERPHAGIKCSTEVAVSTAIPAYPRIASSTLAIDAAVLTTSSSEVFQLLTLTRIARRPCQVVPLKSASPPLTTAAITRSVHWP